MTIAFSNTKLWKPTRHPNTELVPHNDAYDFWCACYDTCSKAEYTSNLLTWDLDDFPYGEIDDDIHETLALTIESVK